MHNAQLLQNHTLWLFPCQCRLFYSNIYRNSDISREICTNVAFLLIIRIHHMLFQLSRLILLPPLQHKAQHTVSQGHNHADTEQQRNEKSSYILCHGAVLCMNV